MRKVETVIEPFPAVPEPTVIPGAPDPAPAAPSKSDELVDAWFAKHFHGLGSMLDERLYNHVYAAKEDLKAELKKL